MYFDNYKIFIVIIQCKKTTIKRKIFVQALTNYYPCCHKAKGKVPKAYD